jgi:hypothetical protein
MPPVIKFRVRFSRLFAIHTGVAIALALACVAILAILLWARTPVAYSATQDLVKLNRFVQTGNNTPAMKLFREGRDSIENEEWAKAAEKFRGFVNAYPRDTDVTPRSTGMPTPSSDRATRRKRRRRSGS